MGRQQATRCISNVVIALCGVAISCWLAWADSCVRDLEQLRPARVLDTSIGKASKCDPNDKTLVSVTWKPEKLSPSGQVEITISYTAPYDMNSGFLNLSLYFHDEPDPFLGYSNTYSCDDIKKYGVSCPLRKRTHVLFKKNITNLHPLTSFPGDYDVIVDVRNEKDQEMLCLNISATVEEI